MKGLLIQVVSDKPKKINGLLSYWGRIQINDFEEKFVMSVAQWSLGDYKRQWHEGLERIKKLPTSCLVTTVQNPNMVPGIERPFINWWTLYRENDKIILHNQILVSELLRETIAPGAFTVDDCYSFIGPKYHLGQEGKISEWVVKLEDLNSGLLCAE